MGEVRVRRDGDLRRHAPRARYPSSGGAHPPRAGCYGGIAVNAATQFGSSGTSEVFRLLQAEGARLVSIFGSTNRDGQKFAHYILDLANREYRVITVLVDGTLPTSTTPAAAWYERELRDRYGIEIQGHPDPRPLLFHAADYPFLKVDGVGVCEVPVGPVHAGIIEPGHFRFSVVGDTVLHLELRHFYTHKGTETIFEGTPVPNGAIIAESISGDNCFAHAVAYSQAVEHGCEAFAPRRAQGIRLVGLELERMLAHIGDVGALCGDVGFAVPAAYTSRLKERLLRQSTRAIGTRYWRS